MDEVGTYRMHKCDFHRSYTNRGGLDFPVCFFIELLINLGIYNRVALGHASDPARLEDYSHAKFLLDPANAFVSPAYFRRVA